MASDRRGPLTKSEIPWALPTEPLGPYSVSARRERHEDDELLWPNLPPEMGFERGLLRDAYVTLDEWSKLSTDERQKVVKALRTTVMIQSAVRTVSMSHHPDADPGLLPRALAFLSEAGGLLDRSRSSTTGFVAEYVRRGRLAMANEKFDPTRDAIDKARGALRRNPALAEDAEWRQSVVASVSVAAGGEASRWGKTPDFEALQLQSRVSSERIARKVLARWHGISFQDVSLGRPRVRKKAKKVE